MKEIIILLVLVSLGVFIITIYSPSYTGNVVAVKDTNYILNNLGEVKEDYNSNIASIPRFVKSIIGNEVVKLDIELSNQTNRTIYFKTIKGKIEYIQESQTEEPTMYVWSDENTVNQISSSKDQVKDLGYALKSGKIRYESVKIITKMRTGIARGAFSVWSWFR